MRLHLRLSVSELESLKTASHEAFPGESIQITLRKLLREMAEGGFPAPEREESVGINVSIDAETLLKLRQVAKSSGVSVNQMVRANLFVLIEWLGSMTSGMEPRSSEDSDV